jgi:hypothetical protein
MITKDVACDAMCRRMCWFSGMLCSFVTTLQDASFVTTLQDASKDSSNM